MWNLKHLANVRFEAVAVDNDALRTNLQTVQRAMHGENRGVEDVVSIDFGHIDHTDRPRQGIALDFGAQCTPACIGQLLRIVERLVVIVGRKDDCGGIDRTGQTTAPRFVTTGLEQPRTVVVSEQHVPHESDDNGRATGHDHEH